MKGKIFNAQEVQAILNGSKVMFREVIKTDKIDFLKLNSLCSAMSFSDCPYQVGQKIFCKESFAEIEFSCLKGYYMGTIIIYRDEEHDVKWKPAQRMKQEHSRLTLLIKEIRVERLAEVSEEDAIAEGFKNTFVGFQHPVYNPGRTANQDFEIFWNATHKKPEEKFEANPFVWVCTMEAVK